MILEICANSFESALVAQQGGADRIELCVDLSVGGLSPSHDLIEKVISELNIPVHVLIRPRAGDFIYTVPEIDLMLNDISYCKNVGCAGIVSGVLTSEKEIDRESTEKLIIASKGMEFTFHRAYDLVVDPKRSLESLIELGVTRLLSSGQQPKAVEGIELLKELKFLSEKQLEIMPGSGINNENALLFKEAGFESLHTSAIKRDHEQSSDSFFDTGVEGISDVNMIKEIIRILS